MSLSAHAVSTLIAICGQSAQPLPPQGPEYGPLPQATSADPAPRRKNGLGKFGPPPPGYERVVGEPMPNWDPNAPEALGPITWSFLGPRPIQDEYWSGIANASGRVVSIAPHPSDANTVYIASASGGIWKTTNQGVTWFPITDELPSLNHGAVALAPLNPSIVYAGTGEYTMQSVGDGIFKSVDAGATWTRVATTAVASTRISGIAVSPANSNHVHATGGNGYLRSLDGGSTWTNPLTGAASSLAIDRVTPTTIYVARHSDGIYKSTDNGSNFTKLAGGLPTSGFARIVIAISSSAPQTLYACFVNTSNGLEGLYRTTNGGTSWTKLTSTPNFPSPQGWYDVFVGVNPTNPNQVLCGGVDPRYAPAGVVRSNDGGSTWTEISAGPSGGQLHPDHHAIAWGPTGTLWVANDGGVWRSTNNGNSWINTNATLEVTQNYQIALHPTDPNQILGGTQDNGTIGRFANAFVWPQVIAGDGGPAHYEPSNPDIAYTTYVRLATYRIDLNSGAWSEISGPWSGDARNFIAPLVGVPGQPQLLFGGTNRLWRTTNALAGTPTWTAISPTTVSSGSALNAIGVAQSNTSVIYTGSNNGAVFVTTNAGGSWTNRSPSGSFSITDIIVNPTNPAEAFVSSSATSGPRVRRTTNSGASWTDVTGSLPAGAAARCLEVDWNRNTPHLYVGTGAGVYVSTDLGATWIKDGSDLPNVNIGDLRIDTLHRTITAGTFGRGTWRASLPKCSSDIDNDGNVDLADFFGFFQCYDLNQPCADIDGQPGVDLGDFFLFFEGYDLGC